MGYESQIKIFDVHSPDIRGCKWAEPIAEFNLCKMAGNDFLEVFDKEIDFKFYEYEYDTILSQEKNKDLYTSIDTNLDKYGDVCKYCSVKALIEALERYQREQEHYRRIMPLLLMLKGFNENEWENLVCVHYGY